MLLNYLLNLARIVLERVEVLVLSKYRYPSIFLRVRAVDVDFVHRVHGTISQNAMVVVRRHCYNPIILKMYLPSKSKMAATQGERRLQPKFGFSWESSTHP